MLNETSANNKNIAKNTIYLYIRMMFSLLVTLYTSRVVLEQLGVVDYGVYNVVASLVLMFSFISGALSSSSGRFLMVEIGRNNKEGIKRMFSMSLNIHLIYMGIVLIFAETFGLWYFYNKLVIPADRMEAALVVFQLSNITTLVQILTIPYTAAIIAYERMKSFAYISIFDVFAKLGIALVISLASSDKLIIYASLLLLVSVIVFFVYSSYCIKRLKELKYIFFWDKVIFRDMFGFCGWSMAGYMGTAFVGQTLNLMLNLFFGPAVNAARAVAFQVQNAVTNFSVNFQKALNPQIVKQYAANDIERMHHLINMSMKISFSLLYILSFPLMVNIKYVLEFWLKEVPPYTEIFVLIILLTSIISSLTNAMSVTAEAANKVGLYNCILTPFYLSSLVVSYICLKLGTNPYAVFLTTLIYEIVSIFIKIQITKRILAVSLFGELLLFFRCVVILALSFILGFCINFYVCDSFIDLVIKYLLCLAVSVTAIYYMVFNKDERESLLTIIINKILKR